MAQDTKEKNPKLLIYAASPGERLEYTFEVLFNCLLNLPYRITHDRRQFESTEGPKLNYSKQKITKQAFFVPAGPLLFETGIREQAIKVENAEGLPAFFHQPVSDADIPFDLPALTFFLVSRYEEYLPFKKDRFGRFPASESLAFKHGFLYRPLINEWAIKLSVLLERKFPRLRIKRPEYLFQPTYDVDMSWAYLHKPMLRNLAGYFRLLVHGNVKELKERFLVQKGKFADPYFTFPYLDDLNKSFCLDPIYFFHMGADGPNDGNTNSRHPAFSDLVKKTGANYSLGIHPSFSSNTRPGLIEMELKQLEKMCEKPVCSSRQHFLMLHFPDTYRRLLKAGIRHDYSMGYAAQLGFRASIAQAFPWYDLQREQATDLMIHPFQLMDVMLKDYLRLSPVEAIESAKKMIRITKKAGGVFSSIWHNSSFSSMHGWGGWKEVYEAVVEMAVGTGTLPHQ